MIPLRLKTLTRCAVLLGASAFSCSSAFASTITYVYSGHSFTQNGTGLPVTSVYATVEFASPLAANLVNAFLTPLQYSFQDGTRTFLTGSAFSAFEFSTNSAGAITTWQVAAGSSASNNFITSINFGVGSQLDQTKFPPAVGADISNSPGSWTVLPEPGTLGMLLTGAVLLLGARRFKRRKTAQA